MTSPQVGNYGFPIIITIMKSDNLPLDISTSASRIIYIINPSGSKIEKLATLLNDGKDGKMYYTVEEELLNISGLWKIQGYVKFSGSAFYTDIQGLTVLPNY